LLAGTSGVDSLLKGLVNNDRGAAATFLRDLSLPISEEKHFDDAWARNTPEKTWELGALFELSAGSRKPDKKRGASPDVVSQTI
jgi:copper(I)-binding protein